MFKGAELTEKERNRRHELKQRKKLKERTYGRSRSQWRERQKMKEKKWEMICCLDVKESLPS